MGDIIKKALGILLLGMFLVLFLGIMLVNFAFAPVVSLVAAIQNEIGFNETTTMWVFWVFVCFILGSLFCVMTQEGQSFKSGLMSIPAFLCLATFINIATLAFNFSTDMKLWDIEDSYLFSQCYFVDILVDSPEDCTGYETFKDFETFAKE